MDITMNEMMRTTYEAVQGDNPSGVLSPDLADICSAGVVRRGERVYLALYAPQRSDHADTLDPWSGERWVNGVHLSSEVSASDPEWRADVLRQGLLLTTQVLTKASSVTSRPIQAVISLQSAADKIDPEIDFPVGAFNMVQLIGPDDDLRSNIEGFVQPVLIVTTAGAGSLGRSSE